MARSSQVLSTERPKGVSMAEVVMDDMAIGNPASLLAHLWRFWASFPGIHIAQFPCQVIGNWGVISLGQCNNDERPRPWQAPLACWVRINCPILIVCWNWPLQLPVGDTHNMTVSWRRRL